MQLTMLGNGAGGPFQGRHYTAQVLQVANQLFLIDCGEGTQMQLHRYRVRYDRIRRIFISHLHGDHIFGLVGLLTSYSLRKRSEKLEIFSPPGLRELVETTFRLCKVQIPYALEFHEVDSTISQKIFENQQVEVWTIPLHHRTECTGWLFRERPRPLNIRPEKITQYDIEFSLIPGIKAGADLHLSDGRKIANAELTLAPKPLRAFAFCSDTAPSQLVADCVRGVNLLYHEATFTEEQVAEADFSGHSTAAQAASIARQAGVGRLLLGHFSGRYADAAQHLKEARAVFAETYAAEEGQTMEI